MGNITAEIYHNDKKMEWNRFISCSKNGLFMFNRDFMEYHKDRFYDYSMLFYEDEKLVALLPGNKKNDIFFSHGGLTYGGFIIGATCKQHTVETCFEVLIEHLRKEGFNKVIYKPIPHIFHKQPAEEDLYALFRCGGRLTEISASTVIKLCDSLKMSKGRKAQISRAKREGVTIRELTNRSDFENFIELENEVLMSRHNTKAAHTGIELYSLFENFPHDIHLYGAFLSEVLIAGVVIFEYDDVIHTQYMAANDIARQIGALDYCVFTLIDKYKAKKKWFDFGISTEDGGKYLNEGLISQKEGFGGRTNVYQKWEITL